MATEGPIINKTGRAIVALSILLFAMGIIVAVLWKGNPANSLDQSALSWSFVLIIVMAGALGLDATAAAVIQAMSAKKNDPS